ncbi:threonylcarbamoyl-AMP synthase [Candidatus Woesearchaeota archaeon]|nr:threonylcarbamoyl-AMP synthase [Candidatus Woesearchaeota archaeon]
MRVVSKREFLKNKQLYFRKILDGAVFIYPTDTIYGIGCDATNSAAVNRIREIKKRDAKPFSIAVPSKEWIACNCVVRVDAKRWLDKLPGPYTLLLKLKNRKAVAGAVHPKTAIVGVRIPANWFSSVVRELGVPIVSTSANITAQSHMTSMSDANPEIISMVDFIIYEGRKAASPSAIVNLAGRKVKVVRR